MRRVTWRAVPAELKTGMYEMKSWGLRFCFFLQRCALESCSGRVQNRDVLEEILGFEVLFFLAAMVLDRFAEMRGVTWRAVLAEFKTGMCEKKSWGLRFCCFSCSIGLGQICGNAQCNLESCSGK